MKNYWFRICFERKFKDKEEADEWFEDMCYDIYNDEDNKEFTYESEERVYDES